MFTVLSPRSLAYARFMLESLFSRSADAIDLTLITDSSADKDLLIDHLSVLNVNGRHWEVHSFDDLNDREAARFARHPNLRLFRRGHPCWRKVTDPLLLSEAGNEIILLDPDLYFPNRFSFEPTPGQSLLLMWQKPNCLFPPETVWKALSAGIPLAAHVDIGVAQWRGAVDLDWLDWLIGKLGGSALPNIMHVEAIVWAAIAMQVGGGHLDPRHWLCWRRTQTKRVLRKVGVPGENILRREPWTEIKCFHAGGEAKYWIAGTIDRGFVQVGDRPTTPAAIVPFVRMQQQKYQREQLIKNRLRQVGYYSLFE